MMNLTLIGYWRSNIAKQPPFGEAESPYTHLAYFIDEGWGIGQEGHHLNLDYNLIVHQIYTEPIKEWMYTHKSISIKKTASILGIMVVALYKILAEGIAFEIMLSIRLLAIANNLQKQLIVSSVEFLIGTWYIKYDTFKQFYLIITMVWFREGTYSPKQ